VAYVGYDSRIRSALSAAPSRPARARVAWGRLAVIAVSGLAWVGIIAAIRAFV
jgi:hypothetical protein